MKKAKVSFVICSLALFTTGCLHPTIGPKSLPPDRAGYSAGIADSWKEQMLLNIVKLRYIDAPIVKHKRFRAFLAAQGFNDPNQCVRG